MKKTKFLAAIIAAIMLTATIAACESAEDEVVVPNEPETVAETPEETPETPTETPTETSDDEEYGEYTVEVYGMKFDLEKATSLTGYVDDVETDITAEEAFEREQNGGNYQAEWDGVAIARRSGESYNTVDDPDAIDSETYETFVDAPTVYESVKVYNDDEIDGFTVKNALFRYVLQGGDRELMMNGFDVVGEVTLTGYITSAKEEGDYMTTGDISFMPDNPETLFFSGGITGGEAGLRYQGDMAFYTNTFGFRLGSIYDENSNDLDVSLIPTDGTNNHVTVTLTNINASHSDVRAVFTTARIVDINQA